MHFDSRQAGAGPGPCAAEVLASALPGKTIGLIPCAVGGTTITNWRDKLAGAGVEFVAGRHVNAVLFDAYAAAQATNRGTIFAQTIEKWRQVFNRVPIVYAELGIADIKKYRYWATAKAQQVVASVPQPSAMIVADGSLLDGAHLDGHSVAEVGHRFGDALLPLLVIR